MRNLFLMLVLGNLAFAAWSAWYAPAPRVARRADPDVPRLMLVSEVPVDLRSTGVVVEPGDAPDAAPAAIVRAVDAPAGAATAEEGAAAEQPAGGVADGAPNAVAGAAEPTPNATAGALCTSVGPFRELSQAAAAAATLRAAGHDPQQRVAEGDLWIGYWVYIPAIATEAEANEILARMRAEGIADSYVIPNSDSGNLVSLGVFSEISGVSRRRDQVRALGFEPQVVDRTRRATVYWVDVTLGPEQKLDFDTLQPQGRIIRLEQRSCESPKG